MDHRLLQSFLTLAQTLHFGRAASARHMSPSTLTRSIKQLEATLGVTLFDRDNRSVTLTREGDLFRRYAREALALWTTLQDNLLDETRQLRGELTLYSSVTASYSFLFDLLAQFRSQHPGIRLSLQTGDPEQAVALVQSGDAQISFGARPGALHGSVAFQKIATTQLVCIAPKDAAPTRHDSWQHRAMILPKRGVARERILQWFRRRNITPKISAQVAGNEAIVSMVSLGGGIGVIPRIVLDNSPLAQRVSVLAIGEDFGSLEVGLFALHKSLRNRIVDALWSTSRALVSPVAPE
ncbi:MAG: HTH-type transcriptional activator IlvY [Gammaproteobacteria bacterium]